MKPNPLASAQPDSRLFLLCDLDGTLAPYGGCHGSPEALAYFRRLLERPELRLAYVTGRTPQEAREVITAHALPTPHYLATDVGSTIERPSTEGYDLVSQWWDTIGRDWLNVSPEKIMAQLAHIPGLIPQESRYQNRYKVCFYADYDAAGDVLINKVQSSLLGLRIRSQVLWSRDKLRNTGYLDILPLGAGKLGAVRWLVSQEQIPEDRVVFAGDAGNDFPVLASGIRAVMPRNGELEILKKAHAHLEKKERGLSRRLYHAKGGFLGMDGDILGGVLEGISMHFPQTREWMLSSAKPMANES